MAWSYLDFFVGYLVGCLVSSIYQVYFKDKPAFERTERDR